MNNRRWHNINSLWGSLMIEELIRNGVDYFCLAPGSRSAPLTAAVALNPKAQSFVHFDERGLAYHALGYVCATNRPAALICTSGTAVANFLPAVIEAAKKKLPLIVMTADRPFELQKSGADQTIDQTGIFGEYVRWQVDLPSPADQIGPEYVLTTIDQAVYRSVGNPPGPVHINCKFREPLSPTIRKKFSGNYLDSLQSWAKTLRPWTKYVRPYPEIPAAKIKDIAQHLSDVHRGVIVVGKLKDADDRAQVCLLSQKLQWPIFPDISSGLRLGTHHDHVVPHFDQLLLSARFQKRFHFDGVLHLGGRLTSKRWLNFVEKTRPNTYIMVLNHPLRSDPLHGVTTRVESKVAVFCRSVENYLPKKKHNSLVNHLSKLSIIVDQAIDTHVLKNKSLSEVSVARLVSQNIPETPHGAGLFLANSMPIRDFDMFADPNGSPVIVAANRGASGIDGTIATASGFAIGLEKPVTVLTGDLALLHDLNSLAMLRGLRYPLIIVVINNDGGGIFSFLPIADFSPGFEKYFATSHGLNFRRAAEMFDLSYCVARSTANFVAVYRKALKRKHSTIIEVTSDRNQNFKIHRDLQKNIVRVVESNLSETKK